MNTWDMIHEYSPNHLNILIAHGLRVIHNKLMGTQSELYRET